MSRDLRILVNLIAAGALLRLLGLGDHPLWLDEGATWSWASRPTWSGTIFAEANHPPAWWIVTRLWMGLTGDGELALRTPAALFGIAAIPMAWRLALRLLAPSRRPARGGFGRLGDEAAARDVALWCAGLVALAPYLVELSQEARMYPMLLVESLGLTLLYLRWLDRGDRLSLAGYAVLAALALYTHYFAVWVPLAHAAHALFAWHRTRDAPDRVSPWPFLGAVVAAGLLFAPWLVHFVTHYQGIARPATGDPFSATLYAVWRMGVGPGLVVADAARAAAGTTRVLAESWPIAVPAVVLWVAVLVAGVLRLRALGGTRSLVTWSVLLPLGILVAIFPLVALLEPRYLIFLAPWVFFAAALGARTSPGRWRPVLSAALVAVVAAGLVGYVTASPALEPEGRSAVVDGRRLPTRYVPAESAPLRFLHQGHPYGREAWRSAQDFVAFLSETERDGARGDLVALHPAYLRLVWRYYDRGRLDTLLLPHKPLSAEALLERHGDALRDRKRVFLVLSHEETEDPDHYLRAFQRALGALWIEAGARRMQVVPPIPFGHWGVRVAIFDRG